MKRRVILIFLGSLIIVFTAILSCYFINNNSSNNLSNRNNTMTNKNSFENSFINNLDYEINENILVSPLSLAYALSMVKEGASGNTLKELENTLNNYKLSFMQSIPNVIGITNSIFIKEIYLNLYPGGQRIRRALPTGFIPDTAVGKRSENCGKFVIKSRIILRPAVV